MPSSLFETVEKTILKFLPNVLKIFSLELFHSFIHSSSFNELSLFGCSPSSVLGRELPSCRLLVNAIHKRPSPERNSNPRDFSLLIENPSSQLTTLAVSVLTYFGRLILSYGAIPPRKLTEFFTLKI